MVYQISGEYQTKGEKMAAYVSLSRGLLQHFKSYQIRQVPRDQNSLADILAKLATDPEIEQYGLVPIGHLEAPSTETQGVNAIIDHSHSWIGPILRFLTTGELPTDIADARKLQYQAPRYVVMDGKLYRRGLSIPFLRCVAGTEVSTIIHEIHGGFCGDHTSGLSLSKKILRQGYFWPTMKKDCVDYVRKCE